MEECLKCQISPLFKYRQNENITYNQIFKKMAIRLLDCKSINTNTRVRYVL